MSDSSSLTPHTHATSMSNSIPGFRPRRYPDHNLEDTSQQSDQLSPRMNDLGGVTTASERYLYSSTSPDSGEFLLIAVLQQLFH